MILVVASANPDKVAEIETILKSVLPGLELRPRPGDVGEIEETGRTLEENARLKASAIAAAPTSVLPAPHGSTTTPEPPAQNDWAASRW